MTEPTADQLFARNPMKVLALTWAMIVGVLFAIYVLNVIPVWGVFLLPVAPARLTYLAHKENRLSSGMSNALKSSVGVAVLAGVVGFVVLVTNGS